MTGSATAVLGAALGLLAAVGTWMLVDADRPPPAQTAQRSVEITGAPQTAVLGVPVAAADRPVPSRPAPAEVVLAGVSVGPGRPSVAIASVDRGPQILLRVGDSVGRSAKVLRIGAESMTYGAGVDEVQVWVRPVAASAATTRPQAPLKTYPGFVAATPAIARTGGAEPGSGNNAFREAMDKKMQAIASGN